MVVGLRVVRGPDWNQADKDGGIHHVGTVTAIKGDNDVEVQWDMGEVTVCRAGRSSKHDLRIFDSAPLGICHAGEVCAGCGEASIAGTRWSCNVCDHVSLCAPCYFDDNHDLSHIFVRIDHPGATPVQQSKRSISQRARAFGIYPNAEVTRGTHWEYDNQDGGAGAVGIVEDVVNYGKDLSQRNAARVRWPRGGTHVYRLGYKGRVDLKCREETPGADYYPEHLACITQAMLQQRSGHEEVMKVGDTVCVHVTKADFRQLQQGRLVWNTRMEELCGEIGTIKAVTIEGDVEIDFGDDVVTVDKSAIAKVPSHKKGDVVRVIDSKQKIQRLQRKHGGWDDGMEEAVGKLGRITVIDADGDVGVALSDSSFVFHPSCLVPAPGQTVPGIPEDTQTDEDSDEESEEETTQTKPTTGETNKPESGQEEEEEGEGMDVLQMLAGLMLLQALSGEAGPNLRERLLHAVVKDQANDVTVILREHPELKEMRHNDIPILSIGAHTGNVSVIKALLDAGADIDVRDEKRNTPLHVSIMADKGDATKYLIERGCTVNVFNTFKRTPLHIAAHKDMPSIVRLLVAKGADPNAQDAIGDTPLHDAISERRDTVATILIELTAMDLWLQNFKHFNALAFACLKAHAHAVDKLISREPRLVSSPETRAHVGFYPIHIAAVNNHINEANILLIKGRADVNAKNDHNVTPLHLAASEGYYDMAKLLLTHEADWTNKDQDGDTALHLCLGGSRTEGRFLRLLGLRNMAEDNDRVKIANLLIQHGADLCAKNNKDRTPVEACDNPRMREAVLTYAQNNKPTKPEPRQSRPKTAKAEQQMFKSSTQKCHKCCQELADTRFLPCRDTVACRKCCFKYKRCPVCSKEISKRVSKDDNTPIAGDSCSIS